MSVLRSLPLTSGVFLVVFVLSAVSAQNDALELSPKSDLESMEEIQELLREVQLIFEKKIANKVRQVIAPDEDEDVAMEPNACTNEGLSSTCCHLFQIRRLRISKEATNPPPTCAKVTRFPKSPKVCIEFNRLEADKSSLKGCSKAIVRMLSFTILNVDLGCFEIKVPNADQQVGEVELPYLEGGEAPVRGPKTFW